MPELTAAVLGASGYVGGELLRILAGHAAIELVQATSRELAGRPLHSVHPHLRDVLPMRFIEPEALTSVDVLFSALPHGQTQRRYDDLRAKATLLVDLSADFRLRDPAMFRRWYGCEHEAAGALDDFVLGLPELARSRLRGAKAIAVPGCMATAAILALHPLVGAGVIGGRVLVDGRIGSSGSSRQASTAGQHPERRDALRVYQPVGHRHEPEIAQACGLPVRMTVTAVGTVRGSQVLVHAAAAGGTTEQDLWDCYRAEYAHEPFVRLVNGRRGVHRLPDPKVLLGSNFCDIGFRVRQDAGDVVLVGALDNLVKGAAGNAVQCVNVALGLDERAGLEFPGLFPN